MSIVIVTKNQYIVASRIHSVTLDEDVDYREIRMPNGKYSTIKDYSYKINVEYVADSSQQTASFSGRDDVRECTVRINKKVDAYKIYSNLISQIREQIPDALFIDQALENMLTGTESIVEEKDAGSIINDAISRKIRPTRKKKRRN